MATTSPQPEGRRAQLSELADARDLARETMHDAVHHATGAVQHAADAAAEAVDDAARAVGQAVAELKPHLRGWLHAATAPLALAVGVAFVTLAETDRARLSAVVFAVTSVVLFGTSALFHRGRWSPAVHDALRRADHANIFLVIAGTYTPFALLLLDGSKGMLLLGIAWGGALAGVLFRTLWLSAPRGLYVPIYIAMGWVSVFFVRDLYAAGGPVVVALLGLGGLLYTIGAVVYGTRRPNPSPRWFGFHEIFHVFTVLGFAAHCVAVGLIVLGR